MIASAGEDITPEERERMQDENYDIMYYTVSAVLSALSILAVMMRTSSRHLKKKAVGIDDLLIALSTVIAAQSFITLLKHFHLTNTALTDSGIGPYNSNMHR